MTGKLLNIITHHIMERKYTDMNLNINENWIKHLNL